MSLAIGRPAVGDALGQAEVGQVAVLAPVLLVDEHVRGLDVPVHQAAPVRRVQGVGHLGGDGDRAGGLEHAFAPQERLEVGALDVPHRDEQAPVGLPRLVDRDDVGVVEPGGEARLAQQALAEALVVGQRRIEELERDRPVEAGVPGEVDLAHAAAAGQLLDAISRELLTREDPPMHGHALLPGDQAHVLMAPRREATACDAAPVRAVAPDFRAS